MKKLSLIIFLIANVALADCDASLKACDVYVQTLEDANKQLAEMVRVKDNELAETKAKLSPSPMPWYIWAITGTAVGFAGRELLK